MRIAVASQGMDLTSKVDNRFGRAPYFLIYDTQSEKAQVVTNGQNVNAVQGAGIQAAENVTNMNVDLVVAGNFGPKAFRALRAAGAKVALRANGTVSEAIELALNDELEICEKANVKGHGW